MNNVKSAIVGGLGLAVIAGLGGCYSVDGHVTWQPNGMPHHDHPYQDWWSYKFVYFPQEQVYFEPYTGDFFWFADGQWEQGPTLPPDVNVDPAEGRVVKLQQQKPYVQHETVLLWNWPHNHPAPGSLDAIHHSSEAFALSEKRTVWRESGVVAEEDWWNAKWSEAEPFEMDLDVTDSPVEDLVGSVDE